MATVFDLQKELMASFNTYPKGRVFDGFRLADYLGTPREVYQITTPEVRQLARAFLTMHRGETETTWLALLDELYAGPTYTHRQLASNFLGLHHSLRRSLDLAYLKRWLEGLAGWCEIDNLCQSNFSAVEMFGRWPKWKKLLSQLVNSKHISHRRASLVLLTRPVRELPDPRLGRVAFDHLRRLENERDILITKAISWLLRELISHHREEVQTFLNAHRETLPKIARREVSRKLATGKK